MSVLERADKIGSNISTKIDIASSAGYVQSLSDAKNLLFSANGTATGAENDAGYKDYAANIKNNVSALIQDSMSSSVAEKDGKKQIDPNRFDNIEEKLGMRDLNTYISRDSYSL